MNDPKPDPTAESDAALDEATNDAVTVDHDGHTYTVDPESTNDVELLDALAELHSGNTLVMPRVVRGLLGADQYEEFLELNRDPKTKRVPKAPLFALYRLINDAVGE